MSNSARFIRLLQSHGSDARYHRADSLIPCPCRTPEGYRDMEWHILNPAQPMCNEAGFLTDPVNTKDITVKAFVQPIQSTRATRLSDEAVAAMFGTVQADDHLGIFPYEWDGVILDFRNWSESGEDYVEYAGQRFISVNANLIPDPADGNPFHHWECGLRVINPAAVI